MKKSLKLFPQVCCGLICLFLFTCSQQVSSQTKEIDSLKTAIEVSVNDTVRLNALNQLSLAFINNGDYSGALQFVNAAIDIGEKNYGSADDGGSNRKIQRIIECLASAYDNKGLIYMYTSDYPKALKQFFNALEIYEKNNNKKNIAYSYKKIGNVYRQESEREKAFEYWDRSLKISREIGDSINMANCYNNIGVAYIDLGDYTKALEYHMQALSIRTKLHDVSGLSASNGNISMAYKSQGNYTKALEYALKSHEALIGTNEKYAFTLSYMRLAEIYTKTQKYQLAEINLNTAHLIAKKIQAADLIQKIHLMYYEFFVSKNDPEKALKQLEIYSALKDSLFNIEKTKQISDVVSKYEIGKREDEIATLKKDQVIKDLTLKKQRNTVVFLIIMLVSFSLFVFFIYNRYKLKQQLKYSLSLAQEKEKSILQVVEATESERKKIAQELHDSVGALMATTKLSVENLLVKNDPLEMKKGLINTSELIDKAATEVRSISHQMASRLLTYFGIVPALNDLVETTLQNVGIAVKFDHFGLDKRYKENIELCLYRVAQEAFSNIIKHAEASNVYIRIQEESNSTLSMIIEDDGVGFDRSVAGEGIGVDNMRSRVHILNGNFTIERANTTTVIRVSIPIESSAINQTILAK